MAATATATMTPLYIDERGEATPLEGKVRDAVQVVMQVLGASPQEPVQRDVRLTTGQAAEIVGTSSKTIARLIDSGKLPGSRVGSGYRTVMLSDLLAFERDSRANAKKHLQEMRDIAEEMGLYSNEHAEAVAAYLDSLS